jgi:hypothetical protein
MPILKEGKMTLFSNTNVAIVAKFLAQTPAYKSITDHILERDPLSAISVAIGKKILIILILYQSCLTWRFLWK